jgi:hypothetical protein
MTSIHALNILVCVILGSKQVPSTISCLDNRENGDSKKKKDQVKKRSIA